MLGSLLFSLFLVTAVRSACICEYPSQPPAPFDANNWPTFFIQNPLIDDAQNGQPCNNFCTYHLDSGNDSLGIGGYQVFRWDNDGGVNYMNIYNANQNYTADTAHPLLYHGIFNSSVSFTSSSRYVVVELNVTKPVVILVALNRMALGAPVTQAPSTTPPVPTTSYSGPYNRNPSLISLDVLFMVDGGSNGQRDQAFNESKLLAAGIVDAFNPGAVFAMNSTNAPSYGSRMTLRYLTNINNQNIGTPWNETPSFISSQVKNLFQIQNSPTDYIGALNGLLSNPLNSPFSISNGPSYVYQNSRNTSQRVAIIVASSIPANLSDLAANTQSLFISLDVHPIFIAYNMTNDDNNEVSKALSPFWGFYTVQNLLTLNDSVKEFVNGYLLDSANVCYVNTTLPGNPTDTPQQVFYPKNYVKQKDSWEEDHQKARYCNFQTFAYTFSVSNDTILQFSVNYELEAGKDFLTFYRSDGSEIVTLSGEDVGPSSFYSKGKTRAVFTSNESQVFGGFNIIYQTTTSAPFL